MSLRMGGNDWIEQNKVLQKRTTVVRLEVPDTAFALS